MTEPEGANASLRHPVIGGVEGLEVADAVAGAAKRRERGLQLRPLRRILEAGHVADDVRARPQQLDDADRDAEEVAFIFGSEALAGA